MSRPTGKAFHLYIGVILWASSRDCRRHLTQYWQYNQCSQYWPMHAVSGHNWVSHSAMHCMLIDYDKLSNNNVEFEHFVEKWTWPKKSTLQINLACEQINGTGSSSHVCRPHTHRVMQQVREAYRPVYTAHSQVMSYITRLGGYF